MKEEKSERLTRFMLDGYVFGEKKRIKVENKEYEIQMFQGEHKNDYLMSEMNEGKVEGLCNLFHNGLLSLSFMIKDGERVGGITEYSKGKALCKEGWDGLLGQDNYRIIENSKEGLNLVIRDKDNSCVVYRGEFDEELNRSGKGIEYDVESGNMRYDGYWGKDELVRMVREFNGDEMIEYEDCDNTDVLKRIPLYIGGYNVIDGDIKRNGLGYVIDEKNGTAKRESEWLNGEEVSIVNLYNGWYFDGMSESIRSILANEQPELYDEPVIHDKLIEVNSSFEMIEYEDSVNLYNGWYVNGINESIRSVLNSEKPIFCEDAVVREKLIEVHSSADMNAITMNVTNLVISSDCCNDITSVELNGYKRLQFIDIGDRCFENVDTFRIDGSNQLKSIKIGMGSFTHFKGTDVWDVRKAYNPSRSFHVLNCDKLESIAIGKYSFSDYSGEFELKKLPSLSSIKIGDIGSESYNFFSSSFVVKGLSNLRSIELGGMAFLRSLSTVISNLPNLKSINLGNQSLLGKDDDNCSLEMKYLEKLEVIVSNDLSFGNPRYVTLSNIPNLKTVRLNLSFLEVNTKDIAEDVALALANLVQTKY